MGDDSNKCPDCTWPVMVWPDLSKGVTVNFKCENPDCESGKGPWDTDWLNHVRN